MLTRIFTEKARLLALSYLVTTPRKLISLSKRKLLFPRSGRVWKLRAPKSSWSSDFSNDMFTSWCFFTTNPFEKNMCSSSNFCFIFPNNFRGEHSKNNWSCHHLVFLFQMCFIQCFFPKIFGSNSSLKGIQPPQTRPPRFVFPSPPVRSSIRCRARSGPTSCQALEFHAGNPSTKTLQNLLIHQEFQVPKMEGFKNLKNRLFWERENSLKPYPYSLYRWGFLHFRYQRHVWW